MSLSVTLSMDPALAVWLERGRAIMSDNTALHASMAQALMDGGELDGRSIIGVPRYITNNAPRYHACATALKANFTNFYEAAAGGVQIIASEQAAGLLFVNGAPFIARAYSASVILPGDGKKYLTIPAIAEAYGKRAGEFGDRLQFQPRGPNLGILTWRTQFSRGVLKQSVRKAATAARPARPAQPSRDTTDDVVVVYWCVPEINAPIDPARMPPDQDIIDLAKIGIARAIQFIATGGSLA